jgi:hypothetical protein
MVPIPEGQVIVRCPFCDLRSLVRGERGLQRYQVARRIDRQQAVGALHKFLTGHRAIAGDAARNARLSEAFLAYIPFWASWSRVLGWVFGQKKVRSNKNTHYKPREIQVVQDMTWNRAACDVGEFGVETVPLTSQPMAPFDPGVLHDSGLVFEPVGSVSEARQGAEDDFMARVQQTADLDRIAQIFVRFVRQRLGLVYYPLWVLRYLYRGRAFQVAVDGHSGEVLYGKAPGNTWYRAAMLVAGCALGSLLAIDGAAASAYMALQISDDGAEAFLGLALALLVVGFGMIAAAYRAFRFGEQFEYRKFGKQPVISPFQIKEVYSQIKDLDTWLNLSN